jgi:aminoglycoside phosphotransferase (APT) family kinase protein
VLSPLRSAARVPAERRGSRPVRAVCQAQDGWHERERRAVARGGVQDGPTRRLVDEAHHAEELRFSLTSMIRSRQRAGVRRWCDWVDEQLAAPAEGVFVHGDFHPDNQLWDARELRLLLVADFETSGVAEPDYEFRAIPSFGPGIDLLTATVDQYVALTERRLSLERIMALYVRTTLGDAL